MPGEIPAPIKPPIAPTARPLAGPAATGSGNSVDPRERARERDPFIKLRFHVGTGPGRSMGRERERLRWVSRKIKPLLEEHTETNGNRAA